MAGDEDLESGLVNLTRVPLNVLRSLDDSVLSHAIRRVLREVDHPPQLLAAFTNSPPGLDDGQPSR